MRCGAMGRIHVFAAVELLLGKDRPMMGEGQEPLTAVIVPHAGITDATVSTASLSSNELDQLASRIEAMAGRVSQLNADLAKLP